MEKDKFTAMLILLIPQVIELIIEKYSIDEIKAAEMFYKSELYSVLEEEETKLWHLSPQMLLSMLDEEKTTGKITYPEEA
jgi:hypothetical protein